MNLNKLYSVAEKEKIYVSNYKMNNNKARIINYNDCNYMFVDYSKIDSYTDEKDAIAEELGHYYYNSYYTIQSTKEEIDRAEYRANKWKAKVLVPISSIQRCFKHHIYSIYDISEILNIKIETLLFALQYYKSNNLL